MQNKNNNKYYNNNNRYNNNKYNNNNRYNNNNKYNNKIDIATMSQKVYSAWFNLLR